MMWEEDFYSTGSKPHLPAGQRSSTQFEGTCMWSLSCKDWAMPILTKHSGQLPELGQVPFVSEHAKLHILFWHAELSIVLGHSIMTIVTGHKHVE